MVLEVVLVDRRGREADCKYISIGSRALFLPAKLISKYSQSKAAGIGRVPFRVEHVSTCI
jgi:hypothetical protein